MSPGPWRLKDDVPWSAWYEIVDVEGNLIADVFTTGKDREQREADARAIAATPDLLAACEGLLEEVSPESINAAIEAVAKAKGEPPQ